MIINLFGCTINKYFTRRSLGPVCDVINTSRCYFKFSCEDKFKIMFKKYFDLGIKLNKMSIKLNKMSRYMCTDLINWGIIFG